MDLAQGGASAGDDSYEDGPPQGLTYSSPPVAAVVLGDPHKSVVQSWAGVVVHEVAFGADPTTYRRGGETVADARARAEDQSTDDYLCELHDRATLWPLSQEQLTHFSTLADERPEDAERYAAEWDAAQGVLPHPPGTFPYIHRLAYQYMRLQAGDCPRQALDNPLDLPPSPHPWLRTWGSGRGYIWHPSGSPQGLVYMRFLALEGHGSWLAQASGTAD